MNLLPADRSDPSSPGLQASRRGVLRTVAWSAPTMLVVGGAPAFATTPGTNPFNVVADLSPLDATTTNFTVTNLGSTTVRVVLVLPRSGGSGSLGFTRVHQTGWDVDAAAGTAWTFIKTLLPREESGILRITWEPDSSGGGTVQVPLTVEATHTQTVDFVLPFTV